MTQVMARPCERCGWVLDPFALVCGNCRALAYRGELERLAGEAVQLEPVDPAGAALRWRRCLELLPPDAAQYASIYQRLHALAAAMAGAAPQPAYGGAYPSGHAAPQTAAPEDPPSVAVLKTVGSMLVSILAYSLFVEGSLAGRLLFATGFVVLILVHELGHVAAMRYYGLSASPPIFIPFLGALINLRQAPANAKVEAVVGMGGPLLGTVGALACYGIYLAMPAGAEARPLVHILAYVGFMLNLFNLLPVPPLDGGRITAALSPRIWALGLAALAAIIVQEMLAGHGMAVVVLTLVLMFALPRVLGTLARRPVGATDRYYAISRTARGTIGAVYIVLGILLLVMRYVTRDALEML